MQPTSFAAWVPLPLPFQPRVELTPRACTPLGTRSRLTPVGTAAGNIAFVNPELCGPSASPPLMRVLAQKFSEFQPPDSINQPIRRG